MEVPYYLGRSLHTHLEEMQHRFYSFVPSLAIVELLATLWAVESLKNMHMTDIIFETSFLLAKDALLNAHSYLFCRDLIDEILQLLPAIRSWSLDYVRSDTNYAANAIALSVTPDYQYQFYVGHQGPTWFHNLLAVEAAQITH
ncbi:unnamed protein product [Microthlaspi erraticum]|uniref:RNase H type-1 domain-containing protein n=1 Tax=Microthlaspi erraticum TaxID=1685480 RepID=A0A6D2KYB7_9BRAS|nr:unnamed protein product [Microthlaspi erraticum]